MVIDNNSPSGDGELLQQSLPRDEFIQLNKNTGYAGGNNYGISQAIMGGADYIFIVNPDVRLQPECLDNYLSVFKKYPKAGGLNPIQLDSEGSGLDGKFENIFTRFTNRFFFCQYIWKPQPVE